MQGRGALCTGPLAQEDGHQGSSWWLRVNVQRATQGPVSSLRMLSFLDQLYTTTAHSSPKVEVLLVFSRTVGVLQTEGSPFEDLGPWAQRPARPSWPSQCGARQMWKKCRVLQNLQEHGPPRAGQGVQIRADLERWRP